MRQSEASSSDSKVKQWPPGSYLGLLHPGTRDQLLSLGRRIEYQSGSTLIRQGSVPDYVFVLLGGVVKVTMAEEFGATTLIAIRMEGDVVGETEALDGEPPLATVTTAAAVDAVAVTKGELRRFFERHPDALFAMSQWLASGQRVLAHRLADSLAADVLTRIARVLLGLVDMHGRRTADGLSLGVLLAQSELAGLVGAAEPSVHRAVRQLRSSGVIETGYRTITVTDVDALRRVAYPTGSRRMVTEKLHHLIELNLVI